MGVPAFWASRGGGLGDGISKPINRHVGPQTASQLVETRVPKRLEHMVSESVIRLRIPSFGVATRRG